MSRQITDSEWSDLIQRFAALERRVNEIDERTVGMVRLGPSPRGPREEVLDALRKEAMDLRSRIVKQEKPFPARETPATPEAMPEEFRKDRPPTSLTDDPTDPRIRRGAPDTEPVPQHDVYLVLSEVERAKGFVRPYRDSYIHVGVGGTEIDPQDRSKSGLKPPGCGVQTKMGRALSETYACNPKFYGYTYCVGCMMHRPVEEFVWTADGARVGS